MKTLSLIMVSRIRRDDECGFIFPQFNRWAIGVFCKQELVRIEGLNHDACFVIVLAELRRSTTFLAFENTIEVGKVVETALETDLGNASRCIDEHASSITQTNVDDIVGEIATCVEFEETTEGAGTHTGNLSELRQTQFFGVVLRDEVLHFQNTARVILNGNLGVAAGSNGRAPSHFANS